MGVSDQVRRPQRIHEPGRVVHCGDPPWGLTAVKNHGFGTVLCTRVTHPFCQQADGLVPSDRFPLATAPFSHPKQRARETVCVCWEMPRGQALGTERAAIRRMIAVPLDANHAPFLMVDVKTTVEVAHLADGLRSFHSSLPVHQTSAAPSPGRCRLGG
jgi:hypothetical protein